MYFDVTYYNVMQFYIMQCNETHWNVMKYNEM